MEDVDQKLEHAPTLRPSVNGYRRHYWTDT